MKTIILYSVFAAIAICANISAQELSLYVYSARYAIFSSVIVGTGAGLITKFILDKVFIFEYRGTGVKDDVGKFLGYTATGVITTLIFWGFEFGFEIIFKTKSARYIGAVIGLSIGYILKYQLDNRYVFQKKVV